MFYYLAQYFLAMLRDDGVESALIKFADDTKVGVDAKHFRGWDRNSKLSQYIGEIV